MLRLIAKSVLLTCALLTAAYASAETISIMTFNVENLFDNVDDPGKSDETYLPVALKASQAHKDKCSTVRSDFWREQCLSWDWSDKVVHQKLSVVARAIGQVNDGSGPDIIVFQEVENARILERLRSDYLEGMGYRPGVLLEGNDKRGIDVAFLAKFPVQDARLHEITFSESIGDRVGDTRPILEATFTLPGGDLLTGYAVHFPAPYHPTEMRESAYTTLNGLLAELPRDRLAFAAGDFNTTREEDSKKDMLARWVRHSWEVAHDLCRDCPGSSYYKPKDEWSFLDMVLWRGAGDWSMQGSYLANGTPEQVTSEGTPNRFRLPEATGVSDHWPVVMEIGKR